MMRNILIIGGTKGIGKAIVDLLVNENNVICMSRNSTEFSHNNYSHITFDSTVDEFPDFEKVDTLIYCPGTINLKPFGSLKEADFLNDFQVNLIGATNCIKHFFRGMKKQENASIVLFSTVAVSQGMPFHASIAAAKGAIEGLTRSLAAEFALQLMIVLILQLLLWLQL